MAVFRFCAWGWVVLGWAVGWASAADPVALREAPRFGATTRFQIALRAEGRFRPAAPPGTPPEKAPKSLALKVETQYAGVERVLKLDRAGGATRVARWVDQAASAINGEVRPMAAALRSEVSLLVAERRDGKVVVVSPGGPLTRAELELVQDVGDPLALPDLLPEKPVAVGDHWRAGADAARALSGYDVLAVNALDVTLEAADARSATLRLKGEIRGAVYGSGEGVIACSGTATFDREAQRLSKLVLERTEMRKPGEVEDGLDMTSTLTVERRGVEEPPELSDAALAGIATEPDPARELLLFVAPDGKYSFLHDRSWHIWHDNVRQTVLKRLDRGEVVAYCNLTTGPQVGKGRHQDLKQFRDDVRRALGERFVAFLGEGEVEGDPAGGFRYKIGVQGKQGELGVLWDYYLVASPDGDQLLVTFTLAAQHEKLFGDEDLKLIGSLRWRGEEKK